MSAEQFKTEMDADLSAHGVDPSVGENIMNLANKLNKKAAAKLGIDYQFDNRCIQCGTTLLEGDVMLCTHHRELASKDMEVS